MKLPAWIEFSEERLAECDDLHEEQPHSTQRGVCGRCGEEYEPYLLFFENSLISYAAFLEAKERYGWFCKDCRGAIFNNSQKGGTE